jgi:hypothetical protein
MSSQQMAQGLVVFLPFDPNISIFYLRPFHCEQFVEVVNKGGGVSKSKYIMFGDTTSPRHKPHSTLLGDMGFPIGCSDFAAHF